MATRKLILVRHSLPEVRSDQPPHEWALSEEGRRRCIPLAQHRDASIISSPERKAVETAELVAQHIATQFDILPGLQENDRTDLGLLPPAEYQALLRAFFEQPDRLVMGKETAKQARERFRAAIESGLCQHTDSDLIVIAHGVVITLFVSAATELAPLPLWESLGMPSAVVLTVPDYKLLEVIHSIR